MAAAAWRNLPTSIEGARIARQLLKRARRHWRALAQAPTPIDADALHEARVALRRLRVWVRLLAPTATHGELDAFQVPLRRLTRRSGPRRSEDVHRAQLEALSTSAELGPVEGGAVAALLTLPYGRPAQPTDADERRLRRAIRRFLDVEPRLAKTLKDLGRTSDGHATAAAWRAHIVRDLARMSQKLEAIQHALDEEPAHEARICAKRVRYALEPIIEACSGADEATAALGRLQELLGNLHDAQTLCFGASHGIADAVPAWANGSIAAVMNGEDPVVAMPASWFAALRGLALLRQRCQTALDDVRREWPTLRDALQENGQQLDTVGPGEPQTLDRMDLVDEAALDGP